MENIFRCSVCKKEFTGVNAEKDCLNDEIKCLNLNEELDKIVKESIHMLEANYNVKILEEKHNVSAQSSNFGYDYKIYKYFNGKAIYKDKEFDFYINNDSVGDGRYEHTLDSIESVVNTFVYKYLREKEIESNEIIGVVERYESHDTEEEDYISQTYSMGYTIGNQNVNDLMYNLEGKKIKIEILE